MGYSRQLPRPEAWYAVWELPQRAGPTPPLGLPACPLTRAYGEARPSVAQNDGIWTASKPAAMGKQGIIQMSKLTKSSLAAKLASDRFRRATCVIEYRPVFGPPFDA